MEQKQLLWAKAEVTSGTDIVPTSAEVLWAENVKFTPKSKAVSGDPAMAALGGVKGYAVEVYGELTFDAPMGGSGAAGTAPKWGVLMKSAGWSETVVADTSVTYALAADPQAGGSLSIYWREGRRKHVLTFAKGMAVPSFDEHQRPVLKCTYRGIMTPVADGAVIVNGDAVWTGHNDIDPVNNAMTTFTYGGVAVPLRSLSVSQSDNVVFSDRPNQKRVDLAGARKFTGNVKFSSVLPSVLNLEALNIANTLSTLVLTHGTTAGKILALTLKAQNEMPSYSTDRGLDVTDAALTIVPSALGSEDQIAIVCT